MITSQDIFLYLISEEVQTMVYVSQSRDEICDNDPMSTRDQTELHVKFDPNRSKCLTSMR